MAAIKISAFQGIKPKVSADLIGESDAQIADNCKLFSGELRSWYRPSVVATPSKAAQGTVKAFFGYDYNGTRYWLNWLKDVDIERGPVAGDTLTRIYFTGDGEPRMSYNTLATQSGTDYPVAAHVLGVFAPTAAPSIIVTGGAGSNVTRSYVYTFKTPLGEESQPSPPLTLTGKVDGSWDLSSLQTPPANTFAVTGATWSAGFATITVASTRGLRVGEEANVSAVNPAGYNASKAVLTEVTGTTIKYAVAVNPGAYVTGGSVDRVATHNTTGMTKLIYRVLPGTAGAEFQFVAEVTGTTYSDTIADSALGDDLLVSEDYEMPPADMKALFSAANGVMGGLSGNQLCLCEPFLPHAWPSKYRIPFLRDTVAAESFSGGSVVMTKSKASMVTGSTPGNMTPDDVETSEPCLSKRGAVSMGFGVIYPSPNGWVLSGIGGTVLASDAVMTKTEFKNFFPSTMLAVSYQERYFAWYTDGNGSVRGIIFDKSGEGPILTPLQQAADAAWTDPESGELYIVHEGKIKLWDGDTLNSLPYDWKSKTFNFADPANMSAARVRAQYSDFGGDFGAEAAQKTADAAYNAAILALSDTWPGQSKTHGDFGGSMLGEFMLGGSLLRDAQFAQYDNRSVQFQLYARDDEKSSPTFGTMILKHTESLIDDRPFRLPGGFVSSEYEVRLLGNVPVKSVEVAESMRGLKQL